MIIINPLSRLFGKTYGKVYCKIEWTPDSDAEHSNNILGTPETLRSGKLTITGVEAPLPSGSCRGACGQIYDELLEAIKDPATKLADGWNAQLVQQFVEIWKEWHLNDLQAGCEHQRALGWDIDGYDAHPSEPCPTCGYKYGTAWLTKKVPQKVLDFLNSLPKAKTKPAWI